MTLQIIGTKKSSETRKAVRYCTERGIPYQFIDLSERSLSSGELSHIIRYIDPEDLIDTQSAFYRKHGYQYLDYDATEEIMEHPQLMRIPVIRLSRQAFLGFDVKTLDAALNGES